MLPTPWRTLLLVLSLSLVVGVPSATAQVERPALWEEGTRTDGAILAMVPPEAATERRERLRLSVLIGLGAGREVPVSRLSVLFLSAPRAPGQVHLSPSGIIALTVSGLRTAENPVRVRWEFGPAGRVVYDAGTILVSVTAGIGLASTVINGGDGPQYIPGQRIGLTAPFEVEAVRRVNAWFGLSAMGYGSVPLFDLDGASTTDPAAELGQWGVLVGVRFGFMH